MSELVNEIADILKKEDDRRFALLATEIDAVQRQIELRMRERADKEISPENQKLQIIATIMQGLLASGHYTRTTTDGDINEPSIKKIYNGSDWREMGFKSIHGSFVVFDAIELLNELERELNE